MPTERCQSEKVERLENIGILWEQSNFDFKWNAAYEAAKLYFEENGSLNVPIGYTTPDGIALGKWVARQQYAYKSPNNSNWQTDSGEGHFAGKDRYAVGKDRPVAA